MLSFFKNTYSIIQNSKLFFNTENIFLDTFALVLHLQKKYMAFVILFSRYISTYTADRKPIRKSISRVFLWQDISF